MSISSVFHAVARFGSLSAFAFGAASLPSFLPIAAQPAVASSDADAPEVEVIATFDAAAGEHPENVALGPDGTLFVTLHVAASVWIAPPGEAGAKLRMPDRTGATGATRVNGVVTHDDGSASVAVASAEPAAAGIWTVGSDGSWAKRADLPPDAGVNGMAADQFGNLYIADDARGLLWTVPAGASRAAIWLDDPTLDRGQEEGVAPYGANGVKVFASAVYVSNPSTSSILRIPIDPSGAAAEPEIAFSGEAFAGADDFALDAAGNLYVASILTNQLLLVEPGGETAVLLDAGDGLANPTAVAIDPGDGQAMELYVTNGAFFGASETGSGASLLRLDLTAPATTGRE